MSVWNIVDSDQQVVFDLFRQHLDIANKLFCDCLDQDLTIHLRTSFINQESKLYFAVRAKRQWSSRVLASSSASRRKLFANILPVAICVRMAAQKGFAASYDESQQGKTSHWLCHGSLCHLNSEKVIQGPSTKKCFNFVLVQFGPIEEGKTSFLKKTWDLMCSTSNHGQKRAAVSLKDMCSSSAAALLSQRGIWIKNIIYKN